MSRDLCLIHGGRHKPQLLHLVLSEQCHEVEAALGRIHGGCNILNGFTLFCLSNATRSRQLLCPWRSQKVSIAHLVLSEQCHEVEAALGRVHGGRYKPQLTHLVLSEQCHEVEAAISRVHGGCISLNWLTLFCLSNATRSRQLLATSMEVAISLNWLTLFCLSNATRSRQLLAVSSLPMEVAIACLTTPLSSKFRINKKYSATFL